jgi:hypothetical protein
VVEEPFVNKRCFRERSKLTNGKQYHFQKEDNMKRLISVALMLLVTLVCVVGFSRAGNAKMYYLTKNTFDGGDAIKSCDPRFHMASLSELQGNTELQYATSLSSAYVPANDEVSGTHIRPGDGWARPVFSAALPADRIPDLGDCEHWTTRSLEVSGTTVQSPIPSYDPNTHYDDPITNIVRDRHFSYSETSCMVNLRVWCVEDPE